MVLKCFNSTKRVIIVCIHFSVEYIHVCKLYRWHRELLGHCYGFGQPCTVYVYSTKIFYMRILYLRRSLFYPPPSFCLFLSLCVWEKDCRLVDIKIWVPEKMEWFPHAQVPTFLLWKWARREIKIQNIFVTPKRPLKIRVWPGKVKNKNSRLKG